MYSFDPYFPRAKDTDTKIFNSRLREIYSCCLIMPFGWLILIKITQWSPSSYIWCTPSMFLQLMFKLYVHTYQTFPYFYLKWCIKYTDVHVILPKIYPSFYPISYTLDLNDRRHNLVTSLWRPSHLCRLLNPLWWISVGISVVIYTPFSDPVIVFICQFY